MMTRLTVVIPTYNRSLYLDRQLQYYDTVKFLGTILIGDSSDDKFEKKSYTSVIKKYPNLDIQYHYFNMKKIAFQHAAVKIVYMLDEIKTPYVAFAGDDDFQVPTGLHQCVEFLDNNPDYIAAHGVRLNFTLDDQIYGNIIGLDAYEGYAWDMDNPVERWHNYMESGIATIFYVHRTPIWKKLFAYSIKAKCDYIGNELIICSLCAILGKVKKLNCLSTVFQRNTLTKVFSFRDTTLWDLIHTNDWIPSVKIFEKAVVMELSKRMPLEEAKKTFHREFWYHCLVVMNNQFNKKYTQSEPAPKTIIDFSNLKKEDPFFHIFNILKGDSK